MPQMLHGQSSSLCQMRKVLQRLLGVFQIGAVAGKGQVIDLGREGAETGLVGMHLAGE